DRLPRLARLAAHWGGHVIAAVLCTGPEGRAVDPSRASRVSAWRKQCEEKELCIVVLQPPPTEVQIFAQPRRPWHPIALPFGWKALYPSVRLELLLLEWISDEEAFYPVWDRLPRLARLAAHWGGHVIAAVLCTGPEGRAVDPSRASRVSAWRKQCEDLCAATEALYPSVRLELLLLEWISDEEAFYPVNALRNFALSLAKHFEFVLQLDVDFLPSRNLRQLLESEA
ncbi:hypothetical protein AK812_SmicGene43067, partial [Symbiodinium microadriaticum]